MLRSQPTCIESTIIPSQPQSHHHTMQPGVFAQFGCNLVFGIISMHDCMTQQLPPGCYLSKSGRCMKNSQRSNMNRQIVIQRHHISEVSLHGRLERGG